ncbi:hypothetical protein BDP55DRAFT_710029 [Colletotrichum godetiae]|uniref:Uncharacterized protein n=1 Tax=Colletotrichum godetiae TaxID=1209918 RepID=A0AAJ0AZJ6_9PEZI|nr:uncharacterized protein BDP55DRAFT_710029 [Colletotrichum godetiae]KAK1700385.1 hypothetical protein BDP55DRAFT_710029 [Colletotrichum godetiae]
MSWCGVPWSWGQVGTMGLGWTHGGGLRSPMTPCIGTCVCLLSLDAPSARDSGPFLRIVLDRIKPPPWLRDPGKEAQEPMHGSPASFDFGLGRGREQPDDDMLCSTWGGPRLRYPYQPR